MMKIYLDLAILLLFPYFVNVRSSVRYIGYENQGLRTADYFGHVLQENVIFFHGVMERSPNVSMVLLQLLGGF